MSTLVATLKDTASTTHARATHALDQRVSPGTRQQYYNRLREWTESNPRLAGFTFLLLTFSLPPTVFFLISIIFILTATLLTTLSIALLTTFTIAATAVSFGLLILLPTLFISTLTALFLFTSGLTIYAIYNALSSNPRTAPYIDAARQKTLETTERAQSAIQELTNTSEPSTSSKANGSAEKSSKSSSSSSTNGDIDTLNDSATAIRDYFGNIDGSKGVYGSEDRIVADTSKSSGIITPGGTLPRNRSYSKPSSTRKAASVDLQDTKEKKRVPDGDVTPLVLEGGLTQEEFVPVNGARPAEVGEIGRTVAPV